jgi:uncharacterized damage-inducible protein DinB
MALVARDGSTPPTAHFTAAHSVRVSSTFADALRGEPASVGIGQQAEQPSTNPIVLDWIRQRASSDAQMRDAADKRTPEPGEIVEPEEHDVATVLTRDHDQVTSLLEQLTAIKGRSKGGTPAHIQRRKSIVDMITERLSTHEYAEQKEFWPAVRDLLSDGGDWADSATQQEHEGNEILTKLGETDPDTDLYDELVDTLVEHCRKHVAFEDRLLLRLKDVTTEGQRRELGERVLAAKQVTI